MRTTAEIWRLPEDMAEDAVLVVSELVTNAQRACPGDRLGLLLRVDDPETPETLRIGVWDPDRTVPTAVQADPLGESGRGLLIVASLAVEHGVIVPKNGGKIVWAAFRVRAADRGPYEKCAQHGGNGRPPVGDVSVNPPDTRPKHVRHDPGLV